MDLVSVSGLIIASILEFFFLLAEAENPILRVRRGRCRTGFESFQILRQVKCFKCSALHPSNVYLGMKRISLVRSPFSLGRRRIPGPQLNTDQPAAGQLLNVQRPQRFPPPPPFHPTDGRTRCSIVAPLLPSGRPTTKRASAGVEISVRPSVRGRARFVHGIESYTSPSSSSSGD